MDCKKDVQIKFGKTLLIDATYDFDWMKVKVDMNITVTDADSLTAKELQNIPIEAAIKQLQGLLTTE